MKSWAEILLIIFIAAFLTLCVVVIVGVAKAQTPEPIARSVNLLPVIPHCDKPLWERITEGCDD